MATTDTSMMVVVSVGPPLQVAQTAKCEILGARRPSAACGPDTPVSSGVNRSCGGRSLIVDSLFGDGNADNDRGIPLIERIAHNAPQFTRDDTPDTVMIDALGPTVAAFSDIIRKHDSMPASKGAKPC